VARRGFTLIEVLVTILLVSVALVGAMHGLRALAAADIRARRADLLQALAQQKLEELRATEDPRTLDDRGDFSEQGHPEITWTLTVQPSGAENVDEVQVTATQGDYSQSLKELIYVPPLAGSAGQ